MDDSPRLLLVAVGLLAVGLLVGYALGHSGVKKARQAGRKRVAAANRDVEAAHKKTEAARKKTAQARQQTVQARQQTAAVQQALSSCTRLHASAPTPARPVRSGPDRTRAVLRLTQAELALRTENAGIARTRMQQAAALLRTLAVRVVASTATALRGAAGQLDRLRETSLRLDPRDRAAVDRLAGQVRELRRSVTYLPLGSTP